jgi:hypothetical protein
MPRVTIVIECERDAAKRTLVIDGFGSMRDTGPRPRGDRRRTAITCHWTL